MTNLILLLALYGVASAICFAMYALDKQAAIGGRRRLPERNLLLAGLLCGWPGGWLAQQLLRHKSSKRPFLARFWLTVVLNAGIVMALVAGDVLHLAGAPF